MFETYCLKLIFLYSKFFGVSECFVTQRAYNLPAIKTRTTNQCAQNWYTDVKYELYQPLATVVMGSYEPIKDMSWGALTGSGTELSEMPPRTDAIQFMLLHHCIHTSYLLFCFFFSEILRNCLTSPYQFGHSYLSVRKL